MPSCRPLRAIPVPAGMDPEQRIKLAVEPAEQAMTYMKDQPTRLASLDRERDRADRLAAEVTDLARQLARLVEEATAREREH